MKGKKRKQDWQDDKNFNRVIRDKYTSARARFIHFDRRDAVKLTAVCGMKKRVCGMESIQWRAGIRDRERNTPKLKIAKAVQSGSFTVKYLLYL